MITLTFDKRAPDPFSNPGYYSKAWDTFLKRMRRRYPALKFARIVELHESGKPHFHVLIDRYIPQKYVSWSFEDCGGGKIAYCQFVDPGRSAKYITKYVTKGFQPRSRGPYFFFVSRMRTVNTSRGLFYKVPRRPGSYFLSAGTFEDVQKELLEYAKNGPFLTNKILIDDPHSPPFVWIPDPQVIEPLLEPRMSFPLTYAHLKAWALDLSDLPTTGNLFVYLPPGFTPLDEQQLKLGLIPEKLDLSQSTASFPEIPAAPTLNKMGKAGTYKQN